MITKPKAIAAITSTLGLLALTLAVTTAFAATPPTIDAAAATNVSATSAELTAQINPNGEDTTYRFEYGTANCSSSPCTSVPVPDADIGSGTDDVQVSQHLSGLTADTTYHWRVLATNADGTVGAATDHTFVYDTSGQVLPDNRAYEQVTPVQKNGATITRYLFDPASSIASDGSRLMAISVQCFADAGSCTGQRENQGEPFAFTRSASGWATTALAPPAAQFPGVNTVTNFDAGADTALFGIPTAPSNEDDFYARQPDGSFAHIGPISPPAGGINLSYATGVPQGTPDFSRVVWNSRSGHWPFDATDPGQAALYEYSPTGNSQPLLVGVSGGPGSSDLISTCSTLLGNSDNGVNPNALSQDASTVYFTATSCSSGSGANAGTAVPADTLYARLDNTGPGAHTVAISEPSVADCSACDTSTPAGAHFIMASADGSKVFFSTAQTLLGTDASTNLYEFDFDAPAGQRVTRLSAGDPTGANVKGTVAVSADGSHVYFVAGGVLTSTPDAQGQTAQSGANNLYAVDATSDQASFIAALPDSDSPEWQGDPGTPANVTPDGRFLVFTSFGQLTPDDTSTTGARQIFRYDAQTEELNRVSIGNQGFNDNGNLGGTCANPSFCPEDARIAPGQKAFAAHRGNPTMSDDGARVFFMSPLALAPRGLNDVRVDANGFLAENVYEWEQPGAGTCPAARSEGCVSLISDGRDAGAGSSECSSGAGFTGASVCLLGTDASGQDVFFTTSDALAPQDTDNGQLDIYDARVGGGFPFTPPPAPCDGDNCKPPPSGVPTDPNLGSSGPNGPGNQGRNLGGTTTSSKKKCKKHKHKHKCKKPRGASTNRGGSK